MSDNQDFGFGKFVPGFEFLQNLAKGSSQALPQLPSLSNWVAPTLSVEDLQKRIDELKAVHFWLDQNSKALSATIQALELQKMTLATLKGMNFNMAEVANSLKLKTGEASSGRAPAAAETSLQEAADAQPAADEGEPTRKGTRAAAKGKGKAADTSQDAVKAAGLVDPLQWWGALTQQFQEIAASAMKEASRQPAVDAARKLTAGATQAAMKMAGGAADSPAAPPAKSASRKASAKPAKKSARAAR